MKILAIDTAGYSVSVAITDNNRVLVNQSVFFPVSASPSGNLGNVFNFLPQMHQKFILSLVGKSFKKTKLDWKDIDAIAVSAYSGVYHCILVGLATASALSHFYKKPLMIADHLLAHIYSCWIERDFREFHFPVLVFSASGSHSGFYLISNFKEGRTIFDRVPKEISGGAETLLGIGKLFYRIGRKLNILSSSEQNVKKVITIMSKGNPFKFDFFSAYRGELFDFDFSELIFMVDELKRRQGKKSKLNSRFVQDVAASFQNAICEIVTEKIMKVAKIINTKEIHITGGISENECLKKKLEEVISKEKLSFDLRYPVKREYGLDNAAMIGILGFYQQKYRIKFSKFNPQITH